jgi:hypothetical protein
MSCALEEVKDFRREEVGDSDSEDIEDSELGREDVELGEVRRRRA